MHGLAYNAVVLLGKSRALIFRQADECDIVACPQPRAQSFNLPISMDSSEMGLYNTIIMMQVGFGVTT